MGGPPPPPQQGDPSQQVPPAHQGYPVHQAPQVQQSYPVQQSFPVSQGSAVPDPGQRRATPRGSDVAALTILAIVCLLPVVFLGFISIFSTIMVGYCDAGCSVPVMETFWYVSMFGPVVVYLVFVVWGIRRAMRAKSSWWLPLIGLGVGIAVWAGASSVIWTMAGRGPLGFL